MKGSEPSLCFPAPALPMELGSISDEIDFSLEVKCFALLGPETIVLGDSGNAVHLLAASLVKRLFLTEPPSSLHGGENFRATAAKKILRKKKASSSILKVGNPQKSLWVVNHVKRWERTKR